MYNQVKNVIFIFIVVFVSTCVEPYEPNITKYENLLVIDGRITNLKEPYEVSISRSFPYDESFGVMVSGAIVKIYEDTGNEVTLTEVGEGKYLSNEEELTGKVGHKYKLHVETPDGQVYESEFEELKQPVEIDSVYFEFEQKPGNNDEPLIGAQIFIDTHDPENKTHWYSWEYEETWEFVVPISSDSRPFVNICYKSFYPKEFLIGNSQNNEDDVILKQPVEFVTNETNRLALKYSVLIKQYVLSEASYLFFEKLISINENGGSLFDTSPMALTGNMYNIVSPEKPVLGIFQVSGASTKRLFINRLELPNNISIPSGFESCDLAIVPLGEDATVDSLLYIGMMIMDTVAMDGVVRLVSGESCFDCTRTGTNVKPDFWDNN